MKQILFTASVINGWVLGATFAISHTHPTITSVSLLTAAILTTVFLAYKFDKECRG